MTSDAPTVVDVAVTPEGGGDRTNGGEEERAADGGEDMAFLFCNRTATLLGDGVGVAAGAAPGMIGVSAIVGPPPDATSVDGGAKATMESDWMTLTARRLESSGKLLATPTAAALAAAKRSSFAAGEASEDGGVASISLNL